MTRYLPYLRLPIVSLLVIVASFGGAFSQTPTLSAEGELASMVQLIHQGKRDEALKQIKLLVKNDESNAEARYYLGIVYLQLNDFKKARNSFQTAIKLQPTLAASAHAQFAYAQALRDKLKAAEPEARTALELDPNNVDALYAMSFVNVRKGEQDEALKNLDLLVTLKPDIADVYLLKSMALVGFNGQRPAVDEVPAQRLFRYQQAADSLEQYLRVSTDRQAAQLWQGQLESLKFYLRAEQPGSTEAYSNRQVTTKFRIIEKPEPSYTEPARAEQVQGRVILRGVVGVAGTIQHVLVVQSLTNGLTEASIAAARRIKFAPAMLDGKPVPVFIQLEYNFNLY